MVVLWLVDVEANLALLVGDTKLLLGTDQHVGAANEVEHHVLQDRLQGGQIDIIEFDLGIRGYLKVRSAYHVEDESAVAYLVVHNPFCNTLVGQGFFLKQVDFHLALNH